MKDLGVCTKITGTQQHNDVGTASSPTVLLEWDLLLRLEHIILLISPKNWLDWPYIGHANYKSLPEALRTLKPLNPKPPCQQGSKSI